jgi:hypothetical protein
VRDVAWAVDAIVRYSALLLRYYLLYETPDALCAYEVGIADMEAYFSAALWCIGQPAPVPGDWRWCGDVAVPHWQHVHQQGLLSRLTTVKRVVLFRLAITEAYLDGRWEEAMLLQMACTIVGKSSAEGVPQDVRVAYEGIASLLTASGVPSDPPHPYPAAEASSKLQAVRGHVNHLVSVLRHRIRIIVGLCGELKDLASQGIAAENVWGLYHRAVLAYSGESDALVRLIDMELTENVTKHSPQVSALLEEAQLAQITAGRYVAAARALQAGQYGSSAYWSSAAKYGAGSDAIPEGAVLATKLVERCIRAAKALAAGTIATSPAVTHAWCMCADLTLSLAPGNEESAKKLRLYVSEMADCWQSIAEALEKGQGSLSNLWEELLQRYESLSKNGSGAKNLKVGPAQENQAVFHDDRNGVESTSNDWSISVEDLGAVHQDDEEGDTVLKGFKSGEDSAQKDLTRIAELKEAIAAREWPQDLAEAEAFTFRVGATVSQQKRAVEKFCATTVSLAATASTSATSTPATADAVPAVPVNSGRRMVKAKVKK